jgi:hypothetical protein
MNANQDVDAAPSPQALSVQPAPTPAASPPSPAAIPLLRRLWESQVELRMQKVAVLFKAIREKKERPVALAAQFDAEIARLDIEIEAEEERIRRLRRDRLQTTSQASQAEAASGSVWGMPLAVSTAVKSALCNCVSP